MIIDQKIIIKELMKNASVYIFFEMVGSTYIVPMTILMQ